MIQVREHQRQVEEFEQRQAEKFEHVEIGKQYSRDVQGLLLGNLINIRCETLTSIRSWPMASCPNLINKMWGMIVIELISITVLKDFLAEVSSLSFV